MTLRKLSFDFDVPEIQLDDIHVEQFTPKEVPVIWPWHPETATGDVWQLLIHAKQSSMLNKVYKPIFPSFENWIEKWQISLSVSPLSHVSDMSHKYLFVSNHNTAMLQFLVSYSSYKHELNAASDNLFSFFVWWIQQENVKGTARFLWPLRLGSLKANPFFSSRPSLRRGHV